AKRIDLAGPAGDHPPPGPGTAVAGAAARPGGAEERGPRPEARAPDDHHLRPRGRPAASSEAGAKERRQENALGLAHGGHQKRRARVSLRLPHRRYAGSRTMRTSRRVGFEGSGWVRSVSTNPFRT